MSNSTAIVCPGSADISCIDEGDNAWMLASTALVILMTPGVALFYGGLVRQKNVLNALYMAFICLGVVTVEWVFVGYTFSFGWHDQGFGNGDWVGFRGVGQEPNPDYAPTISHQVFAVYEMAFAIITPSIISGALVERIGFVSWTIYVIFWSILVYNPLAHWVWAGKTFADGTFQGGLLRQLGALDFAGGTVVHMSSGYAALVAAFICGPRRKVNLRTPPEGHNIPMFMVGVVFLWFGWFGFNGGSALNAGSIAGLAFTNTQIATGTAMTVWAALDYVTKGAITMTGPLSGAVVGLVVITPASGYIHPYSSLAVGAIGSSIIFLLVWAKTTWLNGRWIMKYFDDSLDVFLAHGMGGTLGALLTGCFASLDANPVGANGMFFGNPILFAYQLAACMAAIGITTCGTLVILLVLKYTIGLRYSAGDEEEGVDFVAHKQVAYRIRDIELGVEIEVQDSDFHGLRGSRILSKPMIYALHKAIEKASGRPMGEPTEEDMTELERADEKDEPINEQSVEDTREVFTGRFGSDLYWVWRGDRNKKKKEQKQNKKKTGKEQTKKQQDEKKENGGDNSSSSSDD